MVIEIEKLVKKECSSWLKKNYINFGLYDFQLMIWLKGGWDKQKFLRIAWGFYLHPSWKWTDNFNTWFQQNNKICFRKCLYVNFLKIYIQLVVLKLVQLN